MLIKLDGAHRRRFRDDVAAHRAASTLTDAGYAAKVLRVSLNTLKKCLDRSATLTLKRQTCIGIISSLGLDPGRYGLGGPRAPGAMNVYGGYGKAEFGFIAGQYLVHRRSFLTAENITRSVLEISWNERKGCLSFVERIRYLSDGGVSQAFEYAGDIYMHADRMLMSLLSISDGEVRVTALHAPSRRSPATAMGPIRTAGVLLTHGYPKRFYQPVVSAVAVEQLPKTRPAAQLLALSQTLRPDSEEFTKAAADLKVAEEHALVMTPLMFRESKR